MQTTKNGRESGNILIFILIAIALLAALTFSVTRSNRGGSDTLAQENAALAADSIINYGNQLQGAVNAVMAQGCPLEEVSFQTSRYTRAGLTIAASPPRCHIFDPAGGGITWRNCPDASICTDPYIADPMFANYIAVQDVGTTSSELVMTLLVNENVCRAVNRRANINLDTIPGSTHYTDAPSMYSGTLSAGSLIGDTTHGPEWANYIGKTYGCTASSLVAGLYMFYYVLLPL